MHHSFRQSIVAAALALFALSCGTQHSPLGAARVRVDAANTAMADSITRVTVTLTASDLTEVSVDLARSGNSWMGLLSGIKAGSGRNFHAAAYGSTSQPVFAGDSAATTIVAGQTAIVTIVMQPTVPPIGPNGSAPVMDSIVLSSNDVGPGGQVTAVVSAHDPDPAEDASLVYAWTADLGTFAPADAASTVWTAPANITGPVTATFTITVTNSKMFSGTETVSVTVETAAATGSAQIVVGFNHWPLISAMTPQPSNLAPGQPTTITSAGSDPDGDPLTWAWSSPDCDGTFSSTSLAQIAFTVPAGSTSATCTLHVDLTDGRGGVDHGDLKLAVQGPGTIEVAPQLDYQYQSLLAITAPTTVGLKLSAHSPESLPLTFTWATSKGTLGGQLDTPLGSLNSVALTPSCAAGETATVTATVSDGKGGVAVARFVVAESCP